MYASGRDGSRSTGGGTIINLLFGVIFFGLIAAGVLWVIKGLGDMTGQYNKAMVQATDNASILKCQMNMRSIWQCVQSYEAENGDLPSSQQQLLRICGDSRLFRCDEPNSLPYVYVAGQRLTMPASNVLVYEPNAAHQGRAVVLFLDGRLAALDPNALQRAVAATWTQIQRKP